MNNKKAVIYVAYVILKVLVLFLWMFISHKREMIELKKVEE